MIALPATRTYVSVVVPTRNRPEKLNKCLNSLADQHFSGFEVIVVDASDQDLAPAVERVVAQMPVASYLRDKKREGPAAGRNMGIKQASGEIVAFIDDDCEATTSWLAALTESFADASVVGVEGRTIGRGKVRSLLDHTIENNAGGRYPTCNVAYRLSSLVEVGYFDSKFDWPVHHREDTDLAFRLEDLGRIMFSANAVVLHDVVHLNLKAMIVRDFAYYQDARLMKKHPEKYFARIGLPLPAAFAIYFPLTLLALAIPTLSPVLPCAVAIELVSRRSHENFADVFRILIWRTISSYVRITAVTLGLLACRVSLVRLLRVLSTGGWVYPTNR